jgi:DNA-directed RNA polymerase sigma subunit (sigma70/sigma32)
MHNNRTVRLPEHVSELQRTDRWKGEYYSQFSIDKPNENGDSFSESLPDNRTHRESIFVKEEIEITKKKVEKFLGVLSERESLIIKMHYGIEREEPVKIEKIAEHFDLTTTRINQIIRVSLKKMQGASTLIK